MLELVSNVDLRPIDKAIFHDYSWNVSTQTEDGSGAFHKHDLSEVVVDEGPFGQTNVLQSISHLKEITGWDGGFDSGVILADGTKLYRLSIWMRVKDLGPTPVNNNHIPHGRFYLGSNRLNREGIRHPQDALYTVHTNEYRDNPYFWVHQVSRFAVGEWVLFVAHVHPRNTPMDEPFHPDSGIWLTSGNQAVPPLWGYGHFKFGDTSDVLQLRAYHHYAEVAGVVIQYAHPRIDCCDGSQPTLSQIVSGYGMGLRKTPISVR